MAEIYYHRYYCLGLINQMYIDFRYKGVGLIIISLATLTSVYIQHTQESLAGLHVSSPDFNPVINF